MNLSIIGHHLDVTPAIREYIHSKTARVLRHFDHVIDMHVVLSVEKLNQKAEVTLHVPGKDIFVESIDPNLYAAVDDVTDKLDRQVQKYKQKIQDHGRGQSVASHLDD